MAHQRLAHVDLSQAWESTDGYEKRLKELQDHIKDLQVACYHNRERVIVVLEGWDASGKGGLIRRLTGKMDPRSYRVHPISAPDQRERRQHYLQRFWEKLPPLGHIAIFDRSWYGRVLVERVNQLIDQSTWQRAYREINTFEETLTDDGVVIVKLMMHISQEEQLRRYLERLNNPRKHWKLTEEDIQNRNRAGEYRQAYEEMLEYTDRPDAPWFVIAGEHKWFARTSAIETICRHVASRIDTRIPTFSDEEIAATRALLTTDASDD